MSMKREETWGYRWRSFFVLVEASMFSRAATLFTAGVLIALASKMTHPDRTVEGSTPLRTFFSSLGVTWWSIPLVAGVASAFGLLYPRFDRENVACHLPQSFQDWPGVWRFAVVFLGLNQLIPKIQGIEGPPLIYMLIFCAGVICFCFDGSGGGLGLTMLSTLVIAAVSCVLFPESQTRFCWMAYTVLIASCLIGKIGTQLALVDGQAKHEHVD